MHHDASIHKIVFSFMRISAFRRSPKPSLSRAAGFPCLRSNARHENVLSISENSDCCKTFPDLFNESCRNRSARNCPVQRISRILQHYFASLDTYTYVHTSLGKYTHNENGKKRFHRRRGKGGGLLAPC